MVVFLLQRGANIPHMNELLSFLEEQDQLDSGVLQCLKLLNLSTPAFPGDTATALNYIEKLESIQSICQKSTAVIQNHLTEVVNEVLPKDLANIVSSYDPRALEPTIKVQFFRPPTTHNALFQLQQQLLEQEKTLPGLFAPIIEEMKVTMK
jgi:hypothetical protein